MFSPLVEPAVAGAATVAHKALIGLHSPLSAPSPAGPATSNHFNAMLASIQGEGVQGLVGLKSGDLQGVVSSLSPQQQVNLSQQLMGSRVTVESAGGQLIQGIASQLQMVNGTPVFNVAGHNYSLSNLMSVNQTSAIA